MKSKNIILVIFLVISMILNTCLFFKVLKLKEAIITQEKIFTEVADSLTYFKIQRDSIKNVKSQ